MAKELALSILWAWLYVAVAAAPLALVQVGAGPGGSFTHELGDACGLLALSVMALQLATTARFRWLEPPLGTDLVYAFHRHVTALALAFAVAHPVLLFAPDVRDVLPFLDPFHGAWAFRSGVLSAIALAAIAITSLLRRQLRLPYDGWRRAHAALAVAALTLGSWHALDLGSALSAPVPRALWTVYTGAFLALALRVRVVTPWHLWRRPFVVERVRRQRGPVVAITVRPVGHGGFRFRAGQFAWISAGDSPFLGREHPFSISSGADDAPALEFTIKDAGDWTHRVQSISPGERVYVDGPYGTLSVDRYPRAPGFGFVAGGIGIAPFMSHLRTLARRGDRRPLVLVYGSGAWETTTYREELAALSERLHLERVHVVARPEPGWTGETGMLSRELLARHVPREHGWEWFVCGPPAMMDVAEHALRDLGVHIGRIHSERFDLV